MAALRFDDQLDALGVYGTVSTFISARPDHDLLAATRCRGWTVADLRFHMTCPMAHSDDLVLIEVVTPAGVG